MPGSLLGSGDVEPDLALVGSETISATQGDDGGGGVAGLEFGPAQGVCDVAALGVSQHRSPREGARVIGAQAPLSEGEGHEVEGVDVGAAAQIRGEILALRDKGCAVLVVSEELDELFELSDRLHVIAKGRLSPSVPIADATIERIGEWMSGLWHEEVQAHLGQQPEASHA